MLLLSVQPTPSVSFSHSNVLKIHYKIIEFREHLVGIYKFTVEM